MKNFLAFLKFNNAVPIGFTVLMLGTGSVYAANNPEVIVERVEQVVSIDNSYIADVDLDTYSPTAKILKVEEDGAHYYVTYSLSTIELKDAVWQDVVFEKNIRVEKNGLSPYRDLGLYVTDQINQVIDSELRRLRETQEIERLQRSQKKVAVAYSGLVGGFLSEKIETVKGYTPVVKPPKPEVEKQTFARPDPNVLKQKRAALVAETQPESDVEPVSEVVTPEEETPENESPIPETSNDAPEVTLLGEATVQVPLGAIYNDLGATVLDDHDTSVNLELFLNDVAVENITIDTTIAATYTITYFAEDSGGKTAGTVRTVVVFDSSASTTEESNETPDDGDTATSSEPSEEESAQESSQNEEETDGVESGEPPVTADEEQNTPVEVEGEAESGVVTGPEPIPSGI